MARRIRHVERGQALVEFALILPIFFALLFGILDFSFALYSQMTVMNAAQEAARAASVHPDPTTMFPIAEARANAAAMGLSTADLTVDTPTCVAIVSTTCTFSTTTGSQRGDAVRITVRYTYHPFFPLLSGTSIGLSSTAQMTLQ